MAVGTLVVTPATIYEHEQATVTLTITDFQFEYNNNKSAHIAVYLPTWWAFDPSSNTTLSPSNQGLGYQFPYDGDCYIITTSITVPKVISFKAFAERTASASSIYAKVRSYSASIPGGAQTWVDTTILAGAVTVYPVVQPAVAFTGGSYSVQYDGTIDIPISISSGASVASIAAFSPQIRAIFRADGCDILSVQDDSVWDITSNNSYSSAERPFSQPFL